MNNLENADRVHIHLAPAGVNGPVVAWLYPGGPPASLLEGKTNGMLASGVITEENLLGPLAGESFEALISAMEGGAAYVNVHTTKNPGGEIRGQISANN